MTIRLLHGDCRDVLKTLPDASVDSIVTDPPYELGFMGQAWDSTGVANDSAMWREALRALKPGGHLLAFSGTRTQHRMVCAIEDAGFEIRDQIGWAFGSGFPKSLDVSKAIDAKLGATRDLTKAGEVKRDGYGGDWDTGSSSSRPRRDEPATDAAREWRGWGTALKPAYEPVVMAQKPYTPQQFLAIMAPTIGELLCKVASLAETDTSSSELLRALGFWSTASSLNECLVGLSRTASRFTTETAFAMTTDLRTLKSSLSRLTQAITTGDTSPTSGAASSASDAAAISRSVQAKCERLSATTAGEIAIDWSADEGSGPEGSRLSPDWRSIVVARKPLVGTVAANVLAHGTGALNIDGCRVATDGESFSVPQSDPTKRAGTVGTDLGISGATVAEFKAAQRASIERTATLGRWPANLAHDGSDEVLAAFPESDGQAGAVRGTEPSKTGDANCYGTFRRVKSLQPRGDTGSAARFFYCAKASPSDRGPDNTHPTVKPTDLMRYLCRLVTPPGGVVLDPFMGSGSTLKAAELEGFSAIGIELSAEYIEIARRRITADAPLFTQIESAA